MVFSDVGNNDRVVIQELIKTVAQVNQLETSTQRDFKGALLMPSTSNVLLLDLPEIIFRFRISVVFFSVASSNTYRNCHPFIKICS